MVINNKQMLRMNKSPYASQHWRKLFSMVMVVVVVVLVSYGSTNLFIFSDLFDACFIFDFWFQTVLIDLEDINLTPLGSRF